MVTNFIRATREVIDMEGIDRVSIRRVAAQAGFNSATMYLYFKDADELVTLASMSYLENYCRTLAADLPRMRAPLDIYLYTWRLFCQYAFAHPEVFYRLFYTQHRIPLEETIQRYYQIYPYQLDNISGEMSEVLHSGAMESRNRKLLLPLEEQGLIRPEHLGMINILTIGYFRWLLEECARTDPLGRRGQTEQFLTAIRFLLHHEMLPGQDLFGT